MINTVQSKLVAILSMTGRHSHTINKYYNLPQIWHYIQMICSGIISEYIS